MVYHGTTQIITIATPIKSHPGNITSSLLLLGGSRDEARRHSLELWAPAEEEGIKCPSSTIFLFMSVSQ